MPKTTAPLLPSSVSAPAVSAVYPFVGDREPQRHPKLLLKYPPQPKQRRHHARLASSATIASTSTDTSTDTSTPSVLSTDTASTDTAPTDARPHATHAEPALSIRSASHSRRLTLSRFPLLRKGSRELSRWPSAHFRSPAADSPFLATGAPRASSSLQRRPSVSPASNLAAHADNARVIPEETAPTHPTNGHSTDNKDKMHQTSSRLLRMTDDERPYTRVSITIVFPTTPFACVGPTTGTQCP